MLRALEEPLRQIVANAGDEPSVVVNKVVEGKGNYGFNAQTGEYGDLVEMGVVDPTKVTRFALQNAASVASLLLTTDAMVAELPKDEKAAAAAAWAAAAWAAWATWTCNAGASAGGPQSARSADRTDKARPCAGLLLRSACVRAVARMASHAAVCAADAFAAGRRCSATGDRSGAAVALPCQNALDYKGLFGKPAEQLRLAGRCGAQVE